MTNIVKDVSTLTTIPEKTIDKFYKKMIFCICDGIQETILADTDNISTFNIGIGILYIKHENENSIKYHFEPSPFLEKSIAQTVSSGQNLLEDVLSDTLSKKFMEVYKDLC